MSTLSWRSFFAVLAALSFTRIGPAQERREVPEFRVYGAPSSTNDAAAIDEIIKTFKSAWARQDTETLVSLHVEDTEWINAYARMFQSAAALGDFLEQRLFPGFNADVSRQESANMRIISIRYLGDDAAVVHLYTEGRRGPSRNADEEVRRTHLHFVLAKHGTTWRIVHTAIMDAR